MLGRPVDATGHLVEGLAGWLVQAQIGGRLTNGAHQLDELKVLLKRQVGLHHGEFVRKFHGEKQNRNNEYIHKIQKRKLSARRCFAIVQEIKAKKNKNIRHLNNGTKRPTTISKRHVFILQKMSCFLLLVRRLLLFFSQLQQQHIHTYNLSTLSIYTQYFFLLSFSLYSTMIMSGRHARKPSPGAQQ